MQHRTLVRAMLIGAANTYAPPALARLEHARPRAHLPASRHTAIEPGPA